MSRLRDRLQALEASAGQRQESEDEARRKRVMDDYYDMMNSARAVLDGRARETQAALQRREQGDE